jgi:hypothetical protein
MTPVPTGEIVATVFPSDGALLNSFFESIVWCGAILSIVALIQFQPLGHKVAFCIVSAQRPVAVAFLASLRGQISISGSQRA